METRRPGCFHPLTIIYAAIGIMCLLTGYALFQYARSAQPNPPGHFGNFAALSASFGAVGFTLSGIVILGGILLALVLTRKK